MRLLDVATVVVGDAHFPIEGDERDSSVNVTLDEACTDGVVTGVPVVTRLVDLADTYTFRPFGITIDLERRVRGARDDDQQWLKAAEEDVTEQALGKALTVQPYAGADVWIGSASVATAADVPAGRNAWTAHHIGEPILHVAPENVPTLVGAHIIKVADDGEVVTSWHDRVVVNSGYAGYPSFWTGEVFISLSSIDYEDEINRDILGNLVTLRGYRLAAIDIAPHSIVRVGAMPA